jgi:two-component system sensor histidine kinase AlgZ
VALTITNTVPAPQPHDAPPGAPRGHGIAQANVRDRLRLLHDVDCDFQAGPHKGLYQVRISLPPS